MVPDCINNSCPDCKGSGVYVGLARMTPCTTCRGAVDYKIVNHKVDLLWKRWQVILDPTMTFDEAYLLAKDNGLINP